MNGPVDGKWLDADNAEVLLHERIAGWIRELIAQTRELMSLLRSAKKSRSPSPAGLKFRRGPAG